MSTAIVDAPVSHRDLSAEEARRALYLDFEGFKDQRPALVGWLAEGTFEQIVTDPVLEAAARQKGLRTLPFDAALGELAQRAEEEGRRIVAFSRHELRVTRAWAGIDLDASYADARKILKRWWNRCVPCDRPPAWTQEAFERCAEIKRRRALRGGAATLRLRYVRDQLERRGSYAALTPAAKSKWVKLLRYNEADVRNLRALVVDVAVDLERS